MCGVLFNVVYMHSFFHENLSSYEFFNKFNFIKSILNTKYLNNWKLSLHF